MTLTKNDLLAIDKIVTKRTQPLENGQLRLENGQRNLEKSMLGLENRQTGLEKGQKRIEKRFDKLFNFLDKEHSKLKIEVKNVQAHLHLPVLDF
mgnify:FL=1